MQQINFTYKTITSLINFIKQNSDFFKDYNELLITVFPYRLLEEEVLVITSILKDYFYDAKIIGASTDGAIVDRDHKLLDETVISFVKFQKATITTKYISYKNAYKIKENIKTDTKLIVILSDLGVKLENCLEKINKYVNDIPVIGSVASNIDDPEESFIIENNHIRKNGVVALFISGDVDIYMNYSLAWKPIGITHKITKSKDNIVYEIDNMAVDKLYSKYLGKEIAKKLPKSTLEFPLIYQENDTYITRTLVGQKDAGFIFSGKLEEGREIKFAIIDMPSFKKTTYDGILEINSKNLDIGFVFSGISRKNFVKSFQNIENGTYINKKLNINPIGFFGFGEIYTINNKAKLFNQTITFIGIKEKEAQFISMEDDVKDDTLSVKTNIEIFSALTNLVSAVENDYVTENHRLTSLLELIDDFVMIVKTDLDGNITYISSAYLDMFGYTKEEMMKYGFKLIRAKDVDSKVYKSLWNNIQEGKIWKYKGLKSITKNGDEIYVNIIISPIKDVNGEIVEYVGITKDITKEKLYEKNSYIDALTGLYNRRKFNESIKAYISKCQTAKNSVFGFLMLDIDNFKKYNDTYGHQAGDRVLQQVANVLKITAKRYTDSVFRIGGEEFAILSFFNDDDISKIETFYKSIIKIVENLDIEHKENLPYKKVTISAGGIVIFGNSRFSNYSKMFERILYKKADDELYKAKLGGRNRVLVKFFN